MMRRHQQRFSVPYMSFQYKRCSSTQWTRCCLKLWPAYSFVSTDWEVGAVCSCRDKEACEYDVPHPSSPVVRGASITTS
jgi:hypothetical protein